MREFFKVVNFNRARQEMLSVCSEIIDAYMGQDLKLTLRQLYYQLVVRNAIPNEERAYKRIGNLISDARLAGLLDWDAIEDRVRVPQAPSEFRDLADLVNAAVRSYRLPRWNGQDRYIELWVEKDALSGVLWPLARQYHVTLMVNRGYSSQSAMYDAAQRLKYYSETRRRDCEILYLGDHDPSGEDMVRDIADRLEMFGVECNVEKIALTYDQVQEYNPPPNPTKLTDSRAAGYIEKYGYECWEVDALPPEVLHEMVEAAILMRVDLELMDAIKEKEEKDKAVLKEAAREV